MVDRLDNEGRDHAADPRRVAERGKKCHDSQTISPPYTEPGVLLQEERTDEQPSNDCEKYFVLMLHDVQAASTLELVPVPQRRVRWIVPCDVGVAHIILTIN